MTYNEAMEYMLVLGRQGIVLGTSVMDDLLFELGNPHQKLQFIHVAGTNGKGSVCEFLASILGNGTMKVGHYLSPTIMSYEERWQVVVNGQAKQMKADELPEYVSLCQDAIERMKKNHKALPTQFEVETAISFLYFIKEKCDVVVLEVGMGGAQDATNCVERVLANVITPIANDHSAMLGNFPDDIAKEKAGIIKNDAPVIMAHQNDVVEHIIRERANEFHARVIMPKQYKIVEKNPYDGNDFYYEGKLYHTQMLGRHQIDNCCLALETIKALSTKIEVDVDSIFKGTKKAYHRGRCDLFSQNPVILIDGAHNPAGAKVLQETIELLGEEKLWIGVMGVFKDKDYRGILACMLPELDTLYTLTPPGKRGLDAMILADEVRKSLREVTACHSVKEAMSLAKQQAMDEHKKIVVFGSLSFLSQVYEL